jgi:hypothetical protein
MMGTPPHDLGSEHFQSMRARPRSSFHPRAWPRRCLASKNESNAELNWNLAMKPGPARQPQRAHFRADHQRHFLTELVNVVGAQLDESS